MCTCMMLTATLTGPKQNSVMSSRKFWTLIKMSYGALHNLLMGVTISYHLFLGQLEASRGRSSAARGVTSGLLLTEGPKGSLLGHQGEETRLQGVCDDDVKQLLEVLPARAKKETASTSGAIGTMSGPHPDALSHTSAK